MLRREAKAAAGGWGERLGCLSLAIKGEEQRISETAGTKEGGGPFCFNSQSKMEKPCRDVCSSGFFLHWQW